MARRPSPPTRERRDGGGWSSCYVRRLAPSLLTEGARVLLASDYPFLDIMWTTFIIFALFIWLMLLFRVFADIFRQDEMGGGGKVLWCIFVIFLPFLGVFVYLLAHGNDMAGRDVARAQAPQQQFDSYVQERAAAGGSGVAGQIAQAKQLLDSGAITQAEFDALKAKALT